MHLQYTLCSGQQGTTEGFWRDTLGILGRQNKTSSSRCPTHPSTNKCPNPNCHNLWISYLTQQKDFTGVNKYLAMGRTVWIILVGSTESQGHSKTEAGGSELERRQCDKGRRGGRGKVIRGHSQGRRIVLASWERQRYGFTPRASRKNQPFQHLDFRTSYLRNH